MWNGKSVAWSSTLTLLRALLMLCGRLYEHPEEALAMGCRGREGVLREYNWDKASETLLQAYRTL